jgi:glutamate dehydrogenase (NAD(P)+)
LRNKDIGAFVLVDVFSLSDSLGPALVIHVAQSEIGLRGILVVDNVAAGPSIGGLRMAEDVSLDECFRLARAMTLKNAAAGLRHGGGKSVLVGDPRMDQANKERLIRAFASALKGVDAYIFGPDMGTNEQAMGWVNDEIGRAVGLPREIGGIPLDEIGATGFGLAHATEIACAHAGIDLNGARVAVQGFGAVGSHSARFLAERGAVLVAASDSRGTVMDGGGLDIAALTRTKAEGGNVMDLGSGTSGAVDAILDADCDIWVPAARPDVVDENNVDRLKTRVIVEGANIPVTRDAERRLFERGVLVVPDFIANAGGVICAAMEYQGASQSAALGAIEEKIRYNTEEVLTAAARAGQMPREAAETLAAARVRQAMTTRRWSIF